jgi:hypothetical protein
VHELYSVVDALVEKAMVEQWRKKEHGPADAAIDELEVLQTISVDEARHTILSWQFLWWAVAQEGTDVHDMVAQQLRTMATGHQQDGGQELEAALDNQAAGAAQPLPQGLLRMSHRWAAHHFVVPLLNALATGQPQDQALRSTNANAAASTSGAFTKVLASETGQRLLQALAGAHA